MRKAFLLGAGLGIRLRPMTKALPKPLIPVFHRPLITYALDHCLEAGITDFAINTHHLPEAWDEAFGAGGGSPHAVPAASRRKGMHPGSTHGTYRGASLSFFHEPDLLETGGGIKNIEEWIGDESVLIYNGDILTGIAIDKLITSHTDSNNLATLALRADGPALHIALDDRKVIDIHNMLGVAEGTHQFTGIYCIDPKLLERIPAREKISVIPAFLELAQEGLLGGSVREDGPWLDLGTREAYLDAHHTLELGPAIHPEARVDSAATVESSTIGPGCVVGAGAVLRHSLLWPKTEVAPGAELTNCIVYSSTPATGTHQDADL